jgi:hypothetical protein
MCRHIALERAHAEAMPQASPHRRCADDPGHRHDRFYIPPVGRAAPSLKPPGRKLRIPLRDRQLKRPIESGKEIWRQRNLPDEAVSPALHGFDAGDAAINVDRRRRQCQHFRDASVISSTQNSVAADKQIAVSLSVAFA